MKKNYHHGGRGGAKKWSLYAGKSKLVQTAKWSDNNVGAMHKASAGG